MMLCPSRSLRVWADVFGPAVKKEPGVNLRGLLEGGQHHAAAGHRDARSQDAQRPGLQLQAGEASLAADLLGRQLVNRNGVANAAAVKGAR